MPMTPRETVIRTIRFEGADRLPHEFPEPYGSDFVLVSMSPSPDARPTEGRDEWGALWHNIGVSKVGEVLEPSLKSWADWNRLSVPDIRDPKRWTVLAGARERAGDRFLLAAGISLYERIHFIRGLENTWADIYEAPEDLCRLLDILVDMNLYAIEQYAAAGADGYAWADDWGLQDRLMIAPEKWREIWKPRYARVIESAHAAGLLVLLHSCGEITAILDDLIEVGLDVIQMDQQENMGLERLGRQYGGRITFWCPVDIQGAMTRGTLEEIRAYCRCMVQCLSKREGGFIPKWYPDPVGAGHRPEAIEAMCEEFMRISADWARQREMLCEPVKR